MKRIWKNLLAVLIVLSMLVGCFAFADDLPIDEGTGGTEIVEQGGDEGTGGTEGEGTEGEGTEGEGTEGEGTEGEGTEGEGIEGEGTEGEGAEGECTEGEGTEGECTEGEGTEGEGSEDEGTEGEGTEDEGTEGECTEGEGTGEDEGDEECTHENTDFFSYFETYGAEYINSEKHLAQQREWQSEYCVDCGLILERWIGTENTRELEEAHCYEEDGMCWVCEHDEPVEECAHVNVCRAPDWYLVEVLDSNETGHKMKYECRGQSYECPDCGDYWYEEFDPEDYETREDEEFEPHDFDYDGECWVCGYVNQCQHENYYTEEDSSYIWEQIPGGNNVHRCIEVREVDYYCSECDCYLGFDEYYIDEYEEAHVDDFKELGYCWMCGYVLSKDEPKKETQKKVETVRTVLDADKVLTADEVKNLRKLTIREQMLVIESVLGYGDLVDMALESENLKLSEEAIALIEAINARIAAMTEAEKAAFDALVKETFKTAKVTSPDGQEHEFAVIDLESKTGKKVATTQYGFVAVDGKIKFNRI